MRGARMWKGAQRSFWDDVFKEIGEALMKFANIEQAVEQMRAEIKIQRRMD
jgi:hypothetical protein